jgi:4-amino-4-deoxy-L-arabinose transferase-like glycosyltransferase
MFGGGAGIGRMFGASVGGQISWLIPLCLLVLASVLVAGLLRRAVPRVDRGMWLLWGSWLLVMGLVFSFAQGIFHSYYTTALAPAIAVVAAAGVARLWRWYREPGAAWVLLPIGVGGSAIWAYVLVERDAAWHGWAAAVVVVLGAAAVLTLVGARFGTGRRVGLVLAGVTLLVVPAIWSGATAFAGTRSGGAMAQAGPTQSRRGFGQAGLTAQDRRILAYASKTAPNARITLALEEPSMQAAQWIIDSNVTVIGMGGFDGTDDAPTTTQLADWVRTGQLRFVLGQQQKRGGTASTQRDDWVRQHCAVVDPSVYGGNGQTLYSCTDS